MRAGRGCHPAGQACALAPAAADLPADDDAKTLAAFVQNDRIRHLPTHPDKQRVVLAWLAGHFDAGRTYTEAEVNALLASSRGLRPVAALSG
ncbi:MAG: DUF2087 domain-containing protein [Caldilineaceae bacterium]